MLQNTAFPNEIKKGSSEHNMDSPNLSAIDKASFMEGLQQNHGNPLHSTAMEDDLDDVEGEQMDTGKSRRKDNPQTLKNTGKQRGAPKKMKQTERDEETEAKGDEKKKKRRKSTGGTVKPNRPEEDGKAKKKNRAHHREEESDVEREELAPSAIFQEGNHHTPTVTKHLVDKKPTEKRTARQTSSARPMKNRQRRNGKKSNRESGNKMTSDPQSEEESDAGATQRRREYILSSDEETEKEDVAWKPSPKKAKFYSLDRIRKSSSGTSKSRKSSSGSAAAKAKEAKTAEQRAKRLAGHRGTDLEVVLDAFLHFCEQYSETVESKDVKHSIESFSSNVKRQILEKIAASKDFRNLKRENTKINLLIAVYLFGVSVLLMFYICKVASLIRKKTQRLLDAKHELMRAERQTWLLQKEKTELEGRLADLRRSQAFLHDIREVNRKYLDFRQKHHREEETYGATSLPALLLETRHIQSTEHQLKGINNQLEKRVKMDRC